MNDLTLLKNSTVSGMTNASQMRLWAYVPGSLMIQRLEDIQGQISFFKANLSFGEVKRYVESYDEIIKAQIVAHNKTVEELFGRGTDFSRLDRRQM